MLRLSATVSARVIKLADLLRVREGCVSLLAIHIREGADKNELRESNWDQTVFILTHAMFAHARCMRRVVQVESC